MQRPRLYHRLPTTAHITAAMEKPRVTMRRITTPKATHLPLMTRQKGESAKRPSSVCTGELCTNAFEVSHFSVLIGIVRVIPLLIVLLVLAILFEVYKSDFERWVTPLTDWLDAREAWSWVIPVVILVVLSFPPLFGHEIVLLVVGVSFFLSSTHSYSCVSRSLARRGVGGRARSITSFFSQSRVLI